jgi:peptidoglycan hydrolase CwlO-like protein
MIQINVHHYLHFDTGQLAGIEASLSELTKLVTKGFADMSAELDTLTTEVAENNAVIDSAVTLISGLAQQIASLKNDPVALQALADSLNTKSNELAAAVAANTPAA